MGYKGYKGYNTQGYQMLVYVYTDSGSEGELLAQMEKSRSIDRFLFALAVRDLAVVVTALHTSTKYCTSSSVSTVMGDRHLGI